MYKKRPFCPRCDGKMYRDPIDKEYFVCSECELVLNEDELKAGPPYGFEKDNDIDPDDWMGKDDIDWDDVFDE